MLNSSKDRTSIVIMYLAAIKSCCALTSLSRAQKEAIDWTVVVMPFHHSPVRTCMYFLPVDFPRFLEFAKIQDGLEGRPRNKSVLQNYPTEHM
jgi:hypothetical protein